MLRQSFVPHGPEFSLVVFGTWRLLQGATTPQEVLALLKTCLDHGITTIDTAEIYGGYLVEEMLGRALALDPGVRSRLEIISKFGIYVPSAFHPERQTAFYRSDAARAVKSTEKSLRLLGVEALDLLLVHRPDWMGSVSETAAGLTQLLESGKIKAAGVSNYNTWQFQALQHAMGGRLVTNQVEFSPFHLDPIFDGTFDQCQAEKIRPMAWSPTGGGSLFNAESLPGKRVRAAMQNLRSRYGDAPDDVLCHAWVLSHPVGCFDILGTTKPERIASASKASTLRLEREDWYAVVEAARGHKIP